MPIVIAIVVLLVLAAVVRLFQSPDALDAIGDFGTAVAKPIFVPLVELIALPSFVYVMSLLILVSALAIIATFFFRTVWPERRALRLARIEIAGLPAGKPGDWKGALQRVSDVLSRRRVLLSTLTTYEQEAANQGRLPARRFALFAEEDPWSPLNRRGSVIETLPAYYTTIGLILTFVGLVVALYFAARGFRSGDMGEARASIIQLLNASAFKFLTSVAALISALMISVAYQSGRWRVRNATFELIAAVDLHLQAARVETVSDADSVATEMRRLVEELAATRTALLALQAGQQGRMAS